MIDKRLGKKPKSLAETLLNWSEVSLYFTKNPQNIRANRIPKMHKQKIEQLLYYIKCWDEGKILITPDELAKKVSEIDLNTIILGK